MNGVEHHHEHRVDPEQQWRADLEDMRHQAADHFEHRFDWRGEQPPHDWAGPRFFEPDPKWRLAGRLDREAVGTGDHVQLATSTGKLRDMEVAGQLVFDAPATGERRLTAYRSGRPDADEDEPLFVPFQDATSGLQTYGSGRYLDVPLEDDDTAELDFNFAYNPSCAYSPKYDCPYPPRGNRLDVPVPAGEMVPFEDH